MWWINAVSLWLLKSVERSGLLRNFLPLYVSFTFLFSVCYSHDFLFYPYGISPYCVIFLIISVVFLVIELWHLSPFLYIYLHYELKITEQILTNSSLNMRGKIICQLRALIISEVSFNYSSLTVPMFCLFNLILWCTNTTWILKDFDVY